LTGSYTSGLPLLVRLSLVFLVLLSSLLVQSLSTNCLMDLRAFDTGYWSYPASALTMPPAVLHI
jgi:hypothetical protein